ncbi:MAG: hypothetical protein WD398_01675 [Cyclobacteriaceae bacterium]
MREKRGEMQVLYLDGYKGIRYNIASHQDDFSIYDTKSDPGESQNLAGTSGEFVKLQEEMKNTVLRWRRYNPSAERPYDKEPVPAIEPQNTMAKGIKLSKYKIKSPWAPYIYTSAQPAKEVAILSHIEAPQGEDPYNVMVYEGFLMVGNTGEHEINFRTNGSLVIHIHEALLVDDDHLEMAKGKGSSKIILEKGFHPVKIVYKRGESGPSELELKWSAQGFQNEDLALYHKDS